MGMVNVELGKLTGEGEAVYGEKPDQPGKINAISQQNIVA